MQKNILKLREESDSYLTHVCRYHWSRQISMKVHGVGTLSQQHGFHQLYSSTADESHSVGSKLLLHPLSSRFVCCSNVYRRESGRCHSLSFMLIYFLTFYLSRFSFHIDILTQLILTEQWFVTLFSQVSTLPHHHWQDGQQFSFWLCLHFSCLPHTQLIL